MRVITKSSLKSLRGRIERVFFAGTEFSAGRIQTSSGSLIPFSGKFYAREGSNVILKGKYTKHPKYGEQFQVSSVEHDMNLDADGLIAYLSNNPDVKGIGIARARVLVEQFGNDFDKSLHERPQDMAVAAKVSLDIILAMRAVWDKNHNENAVMTWLSAYGLTHHQVVTLVAKYGASCMDVLKDNPYILIAEIRGFGFKKVDKIARKLGTAKEHPQRIRAGIMFSLNDAMDSQGHCWMGFDDLVSYANEILVMDALDSELKITVQLEELIAEGLLHCETHNAVRCLSLPEIAGYEDVLAGIFKRAQGQSSIAEHLKSTPLESIAELMRCVIEYHSLNNDQQAAIHAALTKRISLISGGAGVGKSFTVSAIVTMLQAHGLHVQLAAPTGKAARRLAEFCDDLENDPMTIHRLLGYNGHEFMLEGKIDTDFLIVDEFSMVDVSLAYHLLTSVDFFRTSVVLVGDHNQLPPVGPGNILRDLINSHAIPTTILEKVVRQAGALKINSMAVLDGEVRPTSDPEEFRCRAWYKVNNLQSPEQVHSFLMMIHEKQLTPFGFDLIKDVQVLTPTHKGPLGTVELNISLQALIQKEKWGVIVPPVQDVNKVPIFLHDKVIQTRNNYDLGVMNGSIGTVDAADGRGNLTVLFDGIPVQYMKNSPEYFELSLAYALTIHKVQGSEFPCVVIIVHKSHSFMHHRNLLYTAVTRSSRTSILLGDQWGMKHCAAHCVVDSRRTLLSYYLEEQKV